MERGIFRQELWINEVLQVESHIGLINEVKFVYSPELWPLCQIRPILVIDAGGFCYG